MSALAKAHEIDAAEPGPDDSFGVFPEGWALGRESWSFHRRFFTVVGRPTRQGEYTALITQIRYKLAEPLNNYHWRVKLADGTPVIVKGGWKRMLWVEAADFLPGPRPAPRPPRIWLIKPLKAKAASAKPPEVVQPAPIARAPPPESANPTPRQPLRASTLTLGNPAAAKKLAERLRRIGIPSSS